MALRSRGTGFSLSFRQAKALAARQGLPLKDFFAQALGERVRRTAGGPPEKPWMRAFGGLRELHHETTRLERLLAVEGGGASDPQQ